jgi:hypothetical protein
VRTFAGPTVLAGLCLAALAVACEVIVPSDVPDFSCVATPGACPNGSQCDATTHRCVAVDAGSGSSSSGGAGDGDVLPIVDSSAPLQGCSTLGCACSLASDCATSICADHRTVGNVATAAQQMSFCTKPCCTSADCDGATVCLATGTGGNYCVLPQWLGRPTTFGTLQGGAVCESDGACRSGLCVAGACADVCCSTAQSATECTGGAICQFGTFPGRAVDRVYAPYCAPAGGTMPNGTACSTGATCRSGFCAPDNQCHDACRNTGECGSAALECGYALPSLTSKEILAVCENSYGTAAARSEGAACTNNNQCQSGYCDAATMQCTDVCFSDSDCTVPNWHCRPSIGMLFGTTFSVSACGP